MIKKITWGAFVLPFLLPVTVWAASQTLTMDWDISGADNITNYIMYFSYDRQMSNKAVACQNSNGAATRTSLTCDFEIAEYPFFAQIAAIEAGTGEEILSEAEQINAENSEPPPPLPLARVLGFKVLPPSDAPATYAINFQPADTAIPAGFSADNGLTFSSARGYGWAKRAREPRDRNNPASPNQSYDTMIHVDPDNTWELRLPNGNYRITVCVGDPSFPDNDNAVKAEGTSIISISNGHLSKSQLWIERSANISVADGRLTLSFAGSSPVAKLSWIKVNKL
jgi:hypothetical protein